MDKLREFTNPDKQSDLQFLQNAQGGGKGKQSKNGDDQPARRQALSLSRDTAKDYMGRTVMTGVDYRNTSLHYNKGVHWQNQFSRYTEKSDYLPLHMQHHSGRLAQNVCTYNSLQQNKLKDKDFMDPISTLNTRKEFWVDPKKLKQSKIQKAVAAGTSEKNKKKNLTFN